MKRFSIIITLLFCATKLSAQDVQLTLEECRELALDNNFSLKSATKKIEQSKEMLAHYKTNFLPNFSLSAGAIYSTAHIEEYVDYPSFVPDFIPEIGVELEVGLAYSGGVKMVQPIYMGSKIATSVKLAKVGVEVAELSQKLSIAEVIIEADKGFYTYLQVEEKLLSAIKYNEVVDEFYRQLQNAYDKGMCTKNDLMKVEVKRNEAKIMVKKAENGLRLSRMNLCYITGLPLTTTSFTLLDEFSESGINSFSLDSLDVSARPEYAMLQRQIDAKKLAVKMARSEYLPSIAAVASYGYQNGGTINGKPLLDGFSFTGGVAISVPIFHWGECLRKINAAKDDVEIAENQFNELSQKMTLELTQAANNYQEATYEVELREGALASATENMRLSKNSYTKGMETLANYLESQALWQMAMSELIDARANQRLNYTAYLKATGVN